MDLSSLEMIQRAPIWESSGQPTSPSCRFPRFEFPYEERTSAISSTAGPLPSERNMVAVQDPWIVEGGTDISGGSHSPTDPAGVQVPPMDKDHGPRHFCFQ